MNRPIEDTSLKLIPNKTSLCFACGTLNDKGLKMEFYTDGSKVVSWVTIPEYLCGWDNIVHGGIVSTVLDEIMSWSAIYLLKKFILTSSINVDFLKPVYAGTRIRVEGAIHDHVHERKALVQGSVFNDNDELCAKSTGKFALFSAEEAKKKGVFSKTVIDSFQFMING